MSKKRKTYQRWGVVLDGGWLVGMMFRTRDEARYYAQQEYSRGRVVRLRVVVM